MTAHRVRLFIAHPQVLLRFRSVLPSVPIHALTAGASLAVISMDDDLQDELHRSNGTGEWLERGVALTTTDLAFAQRVSEAGALAYVETDDSDGTGGQCAVLWRAGAVVAQPAWFETATAGHRPPATWPINVALRGLGVTASAGRDEFATFGLDRYASHEDVLRRALALKV